MFSWIIKFNHYNSFNFNYLLNKVLSYKYLKCYYEIISTKERTKAYPLVRPLVRFFCVFLLSLVRPFVSSLERHIFLLKKKTKTSEARPIECRIFDIRSAIIRVSNIRHLKCVRRMSNIRHPKRVWSKVGFLTFDRRRM